MVQTLPACVPGVRWASIERTALHLCCWKHLFASPRLEADNFTFTVVALDGPRSASSPASWSQLHVPGASKASGTLSPTQSSGVLCRWHASSLRGVGQVGKGRALQLLFRDGWTC